VLLGSPASVQENDILVGDVSVSVICAAVAQAREVASLGGLVVVTWDRCRTVSVGRGELMVSDPAQPRELELMVPVVPPPVSAIETVQE
jgi:hypothetical protein